MKKIFYVRITFCNNQDLRNFSKQLVNINKLPSTVKKLSIKRQKVCKVFSYQLWKNIDSTAFSRKFSRWMTHRWPRPLFHSTFNHRKSNFISMLRKVYRAEQKVFFDGETSIFLMTGHSPEVSNLYCKNVIKTMLKVAYWCSTHDIFVNNTVLRKKKNWKIDAMIKGQWTVINRSDTCGLIFLNILSRVNSFWNKSYWQCPFVKK